MSADPACLFCAIVAGDAPAHRVFEDESCVAFLDHRPLQRGHCVLVPRAHHATLYELPPELLAPLFGAAQRLARAVESAFDADGSFVAVNVRVSQSVPHVHVHVVPRWKKDGLFSTRLLWRRSPYKSAAEAAGAARRIRRALAELSPERAENAIGGAGGATSAGARAPKRERR